MKINTQELAEAIPCYEHKTWISYRHHGRGPAYTKEEGWWIMYDVEDVEAWLRKRARRSSKSKKALAQFREWLEDHRGDRDY